MKIRLPILLLLAAGLASAAPDPQPPALALIQRVLPLAAARFRVETLPPDGAQDVFEVETQNGLVVLRGNNGVSIASALNYYLDRYCHRQMSWDGDNLALPADLPPVPKRVRIASPFARRVYLNYCTFSYSAAWWDWERWQREIDWMAMHGINTPLAVVGQEAVWQAMLRQFSMNDDEIRKFFSGPAYFAWLWMANLEGWGGPLPQTWIDSHRRLGQQILARERELGMTPILQGFTGFVPRALKDKYPRARIQFKPNWCQVFPGTAQLDPLDPLFRRMGTAFLREQAKIYGTDHLYAADPFHESSPPSTEPRYLESVAKEILDTMQAVDRDATIVMQTWSLREPLVTSIPPDRILLLALNGSVARDSQGFWGRPWVAGVLHNYGGRTFLAGGLQRALSNAFDLGQDKTAGKLVGIGVFPEAIEHNPVFYDAATEIAWMHAAPEPAAWLKQEILARYGSAVPGAFQAWDLLLASAYANGAENGSVESPICARPALSIDQAGPNAEFGRHYDTQKVWDAWREMQSASAELKDVDTYRYDLVDVARQAMADLSVPLQKAIGDAYRKQDAQALAAAEVRFLSLAEDLDTLLGTRREFLLGAWIAAAKRWGTNDAERRQYERNARQLVTTWGPSAPEAMLFDYSNRQWSGLIHGYYIPRWRRFFAYLAEAKPGAARFTGEGLHLAYHRPADDANAFYAALARWEQDWSGGTETYRTTPAGDSVDIARRLYSKWEPVRGNMPPAGAEK